MSRKLRPDSTFARISPDVKDAVDELLLSGGSYRAAQELLAEYSVSLSLASIGDYYTTHLLPVKWARQSKSAAVLDQLDAGDVDAATHMAVKQRVFELASSPTPDAKQINTLYGLVLKAEQISQGSKKLALEIDKWQRMAAQALLDKALSPEVQAIVGGSASNEEKINLLRPLLFGTARPITPEFIND